MKDKIRKQIRHLRNNHSEGERKIKSERIKKLLFSTKEFMESDTILFYYSIKDEVNTKKMIEDSLRMGKRIVLPVTDVKNHKLILSEIKNLEDLKNGAFGISEPKDVAPISIKDVHLIIVPGIAFDFRGYRIGYGKGYYDRLLNGLDKHIIGLAYDFQVVDKIPNEMHDVPVKKIVTEKRIIECDGNGHNNER
jgi:5-formyltetrahydrofolate cyclo-ligase